MPQGLNSNSTHIDLVCKCIGTIESCAKELRCLTLVTDNADVLALAQANQVFQMLFFKLTFSGTCSRFRKIPGCIFKLSEEWTIKRINKEIKDIILHNHIWD